MDQEFIDNKKTKDLAQTESIQAVELPYLNIINELSPKDIEFIENDVLPYSLLKNIQNDFALFSEEWQEFFHGIEKKETAFSADITYKFYHLQSPNLSFQNKLISNVYKSSDNFIIKVNESRKEVILTDGEVVKNEKRVLKSADEFFSEIYQNIQLFNTSFLVVLDRKKVTNQFGKWEHHDEYQIYMTDRIKLDYLRMYLGSKYKLN